MKSMTGYGKSLCELEDKLITIEIKSLNSKQLDIYTRLPGIYREKDMDIRNMLTQQLERGKIELTMTVEVTDTKNAGKLNIPVIEDYYRQLKEVGERLDINYDESIFQVIMRLPESLKVEKEELDVTEWKKIEGSIQEALMSVNKFRTQEGDALKVDLLEKVDAIENNLEKVGEYEKQRIDLVKQRINTSLLENIDVEKIDTNRFEQELIYFLEKLDINEEKVRLRNHCKFFKEVCEHNGGNGKKLGFIAQEMGREINTIGSKANHSEIQRIVVMMKDELEKIKEQTLNVL